MAELDIIHAVGVLGFDFGTEARHDAFRQSMAAAGVTAMVEHLAGRPYEAPRLLWTVGAGVTPAYAIVATGPFAREAYEALRQLLDGQSRPEGDPGHVERIGVSARLTGETVRLLSGQVVPEAAIGSPQDLYGWSVQRLPEVLAAAFKQDRPGADDSAVLRTARSFPERIVRDLYDLRNSGHTPQDRALNFAVTHLLEAVSSFSEAAAAGLELAGIAVERSRVPRMNSDCWDAVLRFFDPDGPEQGRRDYRFTIDVSDALPVVLSPRRSGVPTGLIVPVPQPLGSAPAPFAPASSAPAPTSPAPAAAPKPGSPAPAAATDSRPRVQLGGRGAESQDNLDGAAYHFGTHTLGAPARVRVFSIENNLDRPLHLDGKPRVALAGDGADQFEVARDPTSPIPPGGKTTFTVRFKPASPGLKSAELSVANDAPGRAPLVIPLMGMVEAPPNTAVCVTGELLWDGAHRFGAAAIGTAKAGTFTLENPGPAPLAIQGGLTLDGQTEHFAITAPLPATVEAGGRATFAITFKPLSAGAKLAMGRIDHDGEGSPATFLLVGRADGVEIALKQGAREIATGGSHDFGETSPDKPTSTVTFTIENHGAEPLLLTGDPRVILAGADAADFSVQAQPTSPVQPGASTPFTITFSPKSAGQKRAQLKIASNDPDENPYVVELGGLSRSLTVARGKRDRMTADEVMIVYCDKHGAVRYRNFNEGGAVVWREVLALTQVKIVRAGLHGSATYAVKADGTVWSWSYSGGAALPPKQVLGISDVVAMDAGSNFALFVKADGTAWGVGSNNAGQLGTGNNNDSPHQAVKVSELSNVVAVAAGLYTSFALLNDGTVWSWGHNDSGILGNGTGVGAANVPKPIPGLTRIVEIAAFKDNVNYALALRDDGVLWGWGTSSQSGLAQSAPAPRNFPVQITGIPKVKSILAIGRSWQSTSVLTQDGSIFIWGHDYNYRLGRNGNGAVPTVVSGHPAGIEAGCANQYCVVVCDSQGKSWAWGYTGFFGQTVPQQIPSMVVDG
jgi:hypothetical protein